MEQTAPTIQTAQQPPLATSPPAAASAAPTIHYAGFWIRFVAIFIDGIIVGISNTLIRIVLAMMLPEFMVGLITMLAAWAYYVILTKNYRATLGKMALGLEVRSEKSEALSWGQVFLREIVGKLISGILLLIGFVMAGFTDRKRALHDMLAGTVVVYKK